jgi:gamma-tubulin complex component 3
MAAAASVPEPVLVRDVLGACSALQNGRILSFHDDRDGGRWACSATAGVPDTQQQLVSKAAELGWLLRQVELLTAELTTLHSVVHEALVAAARREVANHHRLVAILEAHAQQQAAGTATASAENTLTLRRLQVWLCEPLGRLRVLTMCLELARDVRGGQLINSLHALSKHGDPLVRKVVVPVLEDVCVPFFKQISMWVVSGTVDAASREFLVAKEQLAPPYCDEPAAVWRGGYSLNAAMQPNFLPAQLAADIFTAGKTIAFLREWCGDTRWADAVSEAAKQLATSGGTYQQLRWVMKL